MAHTAHIVRYFCKFIKLEFLPGVLRIAIQKAFYTLLTQDRSSYFCLTFLQKLQKIFSKSRSIEEARDSVTPNPV